MAPNFRLNPRPSRASRNFVSDEFFLLFFPLFSCPFLFLSLVLPFPCHDCHRETRHSRLRRESRPPEIVVLVRPRIMQWAGMLPSDHAVAAGCSGSAGYNSGSVRLLSCSQDLLGLKHRLQSLACLSLSTVPPPSVPAMSLSLSVVCFSCGEEGHMRSSCPKRGRTCSAPRGPACSGARSVRDVTSPHYLLPLLLTLLILSTADDR